MNIYFVRHGLTDGNEADEFQLPTTELSPKGIDQAEKVAKYLETIPIDIVFASPMTRASQTTNIIAKHIGHAVIEDPLFEEIKRPSAVRGKSKTDLEVKAIMEVVKRTFADPNNRHSDEEDYFQSRGRAKKIMSFLSERKEQNILVVTHGEILRMILSLVIFGESLTPQIFDEIKRTFIPFNTGITLIQYDQSFGYHKSGWYVLGWNIMHIQRS